MATKKVVKKKGFVVVYLNVGAMPSFKAEALVERIKDSLKTFQEGCEENGYLVVYIPARNSETRIETFVF